MIEVKEKIHNYLKVLIAQKVDYDDPVNTDIDIDTNLMKTHRIKYFWFGVKTIGIKSVWHGKYRIINGSLLLNYYW